MKKTVVSMAVAGAIFSAFCNGAYAEITVLSKNSINNSILSPLSVTVGGSVRASLKYLNGPEPGFYKNGHDGGSRAHISADYTLTPDMSVVGYTEEGFDLAHILEMKGHYYEKGGRKKERQLYTGIKDQRFGTLTFGHQHGIYYSVIGIKSDVWLNDGHAGATIIGVNGDYDGANRPERSLKYTKNIGPVTLYTNYLLPLQDKNLATGVRYKRNSGQGIGLDYHITDQLTLGTAWSLTRATIKTAGGQNKDYNQQVSGMALSWKNGGWYLAGTASYYKDFVPAQSGRTWDKYFYNHGYGVEGFAGYKFMINKPWLDSRKPYVAADSLQLHNKENYHANHVYLGLGSDFGHGIWLYVEKTLSATSSKEADATWLTLFYNF